jgi:hypothetical protein
MREYRVSAARTLEEQVYTGIQWIQFFDDIKPEDEGYVVVTWDDVDLNQMWFVEGDAGLEELKRYHADRGKTVKMMILKYMEWRKTEGL